MDLRDKVPYVTHRTNDTKFVVVRFKIKTMVIAVVDVHTGHEFGRIEFLKGKYRFTAYGGVPYTEDQLKDVENIISTITIPRKVKPKTVGVVCNHYQDFNDWSRKYNKRWGIQRKFIAGTTTYVAISRQQHLMGYRFDRLIQTDNAKLNPQFDKIMAQSVYCLP